MVAMNIVRVVLQALAWARSLQEMCVQDAAQISKLTQELEEAQSEVNLEKINQEMAERLVEKFKQEYIAELKSTGEKTCLKRKTEETNRFNDALSNAEVDGYNKCVKKAKEKGLRYKKLLLDPTNDPLKQSAREFTSTTEKLNNLDDVPESTATVPTPNAISPA
ncbi:uncharacterized protein LOC141705150 isoform X1 [Apium graveolens]|uniref:uncharacterized protein LOC141672377 isoform X1 n=1 Tax=Apium graveolens TaxID=4045 RepID=UPI003D7AE55A